MSPEVLPTVAGLDPSSSPLVSAAVAYLRKHCSHPTANHCIRPVYFMQLFVNKVPKFANAVAEGTINLETCTVAILLHDLGWATTKEILSKDKRFEVDGAELAVKFVQDQISATKTDAHTWDKARFEELWTAIVLHSAPSIAQHHPNPTICLVQLAILADAFGLNLPPPLTGTITVDEYKAVLKAFPMDGFKEDLIKNMCWLCREKPETTFDNFVSLFALEFGLDGKGQGKEDFKKEYEARIIPKIVAGVIDSCIETARD